MQLANRATCPSEKSLKQERKRHSAPFERVMVHSQGKRRYYSEHPAVLLGEALKTRLQESGEPTERLIFFQPFDDKWYACVIDKGEVETESLATIGELEEELGYWLYNCEHILVASSEASEPLTFHKNKQILVKPLIEADWQGYILTAKAGTPKVWIGVLALVVASLSFGGFWLGQQEPPPKPQIAKTTPEEVLIESLRNKPLASPALQLATKIMLETHLMPDGMNVNEVNLVDGALTAKLDLTARDKVIRQYLLANPEIDDWLNEERSLLTLDVPKADHWRAYDVSTYLTDMRDALELMNVSVTEDGQRDVGRFSVVSLTLTTTGRLGKLPLIMQILTPSFITTRKLTLSWNDEDITELYLEIEIQGVYSEPN
ncbi:hypothetical protein QWZ04_23450 [Vibrio tapetis subsp. quintayensis]|uniref:hypothetical protein n=1 Tax=Vibrio tapetis TaxID=52443 RepID=UPI0025B30886|nr:hypothetical protein [Vibrio tapetis]MDN3683261.1 hypothetical protein [Vibrio tapetis subsp. quintayensis]